MLTSDLVRVTLRKDRIYPRMLTIDDANIQFAESLIHEWKAHVGKPRELWNEALKDRIGDSPNYMVARGLGKLLDDRSEWLQPHDVDPVEVRQALYELSAEHFPVLPKKTKVQPVNRAELIQKVAAQFGVEARVIEESMYGDRKEEQRLADLNDISAEELLLRYNMSNTQAILLRAVELTITLDADTDNKRVRELFRYLKFHRLIYSAEREHDDGSWLVQVDGPMSLFSQSRRYGFQMALFLPSLLLLDTWRLEAKIEWPSRDHPVWLKLDDSTDLQTWKRSRGAWATDEEKMLRDRIGEGRDGWTLCESTEVVRLDGGDVLVPDFVMKSRNGELVYVEIVGYWRKSYLEHRMELLARDAPEQLVLCVSRKLTVDEELESAPLEYVDYARVIPITRFMEAVKRAAQ